MPLLEVGYSSFLLDISYSVFLRFVLAWLFHWFLLILVSSLFSFLLFLLPHLTSFFPCMICVRRPWALSDKDTLMFYYEYLINHGLVTFLLKKWSLSSHFSDVVFFYFSVLFFFYDVEYTHRSCIKWLQNWINISWHVLYSTYLRTLQGRRYVERPWCPCTRINLYFPTN